MATTPEQDDEEPVTFFEVGLDDVSVARLMTIAEQHRVDPRTFLSLIVRDVLEDDALQHEGIEVDPNARKYTH